MADTPTPSPVPENPAPQNPAPTPTPMPAPVQPAQVQITPAPVLAPAPKVPLTPEEKRAARKTMFKRMGMMFGIFYVLVLVFIFLWATVFASQSLGFFSALGTSQMEVQRGMMMLTHAMFLVPLFSVLLVALFGLLKSLMLKKEEIEKKKKASKLALFGGLGFLLLAILWLASIFYLGPRLTPEQRFTSYIITEPAEPVGLTAPVEILFDARAIPVNTSDYQILSYTWNFGDGSVGSGPVVTHRYTKKSPTGTYTVMLTVNLRDLGTGATSTQQFSTIVGIENEKVAASFTATPRSGELPLDVEFNASASYDPDGQIVSYEWDLDGDGQFDDAEGATADYTYSSEGEYIVSLRVTDNNGETNIAEETISAGSVGGLRAVITAPLQSDQSYVAGESYEFTGESSRIDDGTITKYVWDFGDDSNVVQSRSTSHTFEEEGAYIITLTVHDPDGNTHESELEIEVVDQGTPPTAKLETVPTLLNDIVSGPVPLEVEFDATISTDPQDDIIDYEWDFDNDGEVDDTGDTATYTYEEVDTYEARLIVTDSAGNSNEKIITVDVKEQGVIARLSATVTSGEVPLTVTFDSSSSTYKEGDIVSYEYDFGDGSDLYIGGSKVSYKYTDVGTFTVTMTAVGDDGKRDSTTLQVVVRPVAITACFTVNTDNGNAPLFVSVDPSCSSGSIRTYHWDFDDGSISFDRKPDVHTYEDEGTYTIELEVTSDQGVVDVFELTVVVD